MDFYHIEIKTGPLEPHSFPHSGQSGAEVSFLGIVRAEEADGTPIRGISYEAHPKLAKYWLERVAQDTTKKFPLTALHLVHSMGFIPVGKTSLVLHIRARHRKEAFEACAWAVDELKRRVPIWKHPVTIKTPLS